MGGNTCGAALSSDSRLGAGCEIAGCLSMDCVSMLPVEHEHKLWNYNIFGSKMKIIMHVVY